MSKVDGLDDLEASYEALERAIEAARLSAPPPRCAPSRLLETAEPSPERLRAAAADTSLERARAIMGETWTNRLAALLLLDVARKHPSTRMQRADRYSLVPLY